MVYMLLANGYEEAEAIVPCDILRRGGVEVKLVGVTGKTAVSARNIRLDTDLLLEELDPSDLEMLVLPGGLDSTNTLAANETVQSLIRDTLEKGKWLAAICAAPTVFGGMGILEGRKAVCYPGMEEGLKGACPCKGEQVVVDGKIITGEGPGSAYEFGYQLLETLKGKEVLEQVKHGMHFHH